MKKFRIQYTNVVYTEVEAKTKQEAFEQFLDDPSKAEVSNVEAYQDPSIEEI
jgi:hypothetical protein